MQIGLHCVETALLQTIGSDFIHQPYTPAFLIHINNNTFSFGFDRLHGFMQLLPAIATHRPKNITRHTRGMNPNQYRFIGFPRSLYQSNMFQPIGKLTERNQPEMSVLRRHIHLVSTFYHRLLFQAISDQITYGDNLYTELFGYLSQLWQSSHCTVFIQNFDQRGCGI